MSDAATKTVGILYGGEMGVAVAAALRARGVRVVTAVHGRSERTAARCREAGIEILASLEDVAKQANVVLSLVSPAAAEEVAAAYGECAKLAPRRAVYVDVNSVRPELAIAIGERITAARIDFVDAAINGLAKNLASGGTLFLSGGRASEIATLFGGDGGAVARVRVIGTDPGVASAMKMLLGGLSKGLCALFAELASVAHRRDLLPQMLASCNEIYPGVMQVIDRMLPTYAQHSGRRAEEMRELEETTRASSLEPCVVDAVRRFHEAMAEMNWNDGSGASVQAVIDCLIKNQLLSPSEV